MKTSLSMRFPRWSAPLVGAIVCGFLSAKVAAKDQRFAEPKWILFGVILGAAVGCLVFIADKDDAKSDSTADAGTVMSRVMAMVSIPAVIIPLMNLAVSGISLHMNWEVRGWSRTLSWIAMVVSAMLSAVALVAIVANQ